MLFSARVAQIQNRIVELEPSLVTAQPDLGHADAAVWQRGDKHATLTYHSDPPVPSLTLIMLAGDEEHPDALEIGFADPDVVDMVARPITDLLMDRLQPAKKP